ncbi:MAG: glycosyltransferase family 39 protein [Microthrixaceae bacterium]
MTEPLDGDGTHEAPAVDRGLIAVVAVAVVAGVVYRFLPRSDLWLDEALSVNIARLPLGEIGDALRRDGHPPLYYWLLHLWTAAGTSDWWVRALSGVISLVGFPLAYLAGARMADRADRADGSGGSALGRRRLGLLAMATYAVLPFGVRYGSETRMYSLVMVLVLAGYLLADDLLADRPRRGGTWLTAAGLALVTAGLLWSHYWAMWLVAAVGLLALWRLWRTRSDRAARRGPLAAVGALVVGGVLFLPWVPNLLYQSAHTGTPWGKTFRPATMVVVTIVDLAGGSFSEPQAGSYLLVLLLALACLAVPVGTRLYLRWGVSTRVRNELVVVALTMAIAWAVAFASSSTFASRYSAVVVPLLMLCIAAGIATARSRTATVVLMALVTVVGVFGSTVEVFRDRTQTGVAATEILADRARNGKGPAVVVTCPDQLGPATTRALGNRTEDPPEVIPFPTGGDPRFVNWVDYEQRNRAADPTAFVASIEPRIPADATVYLVANMSYLTFEDKCEQVLAQLATNRDVTPIVSGDADNFYEATSLWALRPRA